MMLTYCGADLRQALKTNRDKQLRGYKNMEKFFYVLKLSQRWFKR